MNDNDNSIPVNNDVSPVNLSSAPSPSPSPTTSQPSVVGPSANASNLSVSSNHKPKKGKKVLKVIFFLLLLLAVAGGSSYAAYNMGKENEKNKPVPEVTTQPIDLPPEAIVTSECTPGRGKQYIVPKDIPVGPIYDVKNSKVIAIEYMMGIKALLTNSDAFSSTLLLLTKNYPVDHFNIVPQPPKPTDTDQFINLIMFVVPKEEANSITCEGETTSTTDTTTTPATTPATDTTTE